MFGVFVLLFCFCWCSPKQAIFLALWPQVEGVLGFLSRVDGLLYAKVEDANLELGDKFRGYVSRVSGGKMWVETLTSAKMLKRALKWVLSNISVLEYLLKLV